MEQQAIDRAHRLGQTEIVNVYHLICNETIETNIVQLQEEKMQLARGVLGDVSLIGGNGPTVRDFAMLFSHRSMSSAFVGQDQDDEEEIVLTTTTNNNSL